LRVGILGGAFNPPHIGHLVCAQEALVQLELDRVREGVPIRYLVPDRVVDYIATNELYGGQGSRTEALAK
jgi:nicotinic acid mononucleotide adenylyltransferase